MKFPTLKKSSPSAADEQVEQMGVATAKEMVTARTVATLIRGVLLFGVPLVAVAGLGLGALAYFSSVAPVVATSQQADHRGEQARAGEHASRAVVAWLVADRGNDELVTSLFPAKAELMLPTVGFVAADPQVAAVEQAGDVWAVTIGVTVTDVAKVTTRRYFQVPIRVVKDAVAAIALPSPVAAPAAADPVLLGYKELADTGGPLQAAVEQFLGAFLAGVGDVSVYTQPGSVLAAVVPTPYTSVKVTSVAVDNRELDTSIPPGSGDTARVLVSAQASVSPEQSVTVNYALTLKARDGRWEVSAIDSVPVWVAQSSDADASEPSAQPVVPTPSTPVEEK